MGTHFLSSLKKANVESYGLVPGTNTLGKKKNLLLYLDLFDWAKACRI